MRQCLLCRLIPAIHLILCVILLTAAPAFAAKQQFTPTLSITEEYTDNVGLDQNNTRDDFITRYALGLTFGRIDRTSSLFFSYKPEYVDYMDENENDAWDHNASINATFNISRRTTFMFSDDFNRSLDRTERTNSLEQTDTNTATAMFEHRYGEKDMIRFSYEHTINDYEDQNEDEFTRHRPSLYFSYWFTPLFGFDTNASYSDTEYEFAADDPQTSKGDIRFLYNINRHFNVYIKYAHTLTDQDSGDHTIYNPSAGFEWEPTDDSGITFGAGVLFQDYENQTGYEEEQLFIEADFYKNFNFSRRNTLSITGSSGYGDIDDDSSSLGFTIHYEAGALHQYKLTRNLTSELSATYRIKEFDEPGVDREDDTLDLGARLIWRPLKWLSLNFRYDYTDFATDAADRDDYQENRFSVMVDLSPSGPMRLDSGRTGRQKLEERLFD